MKRFTTETLSEIFRYLVSRRSELQGGETLSFEVVDPDLHRGAWPGEMQQREGLSWRYRSYKTWIDLAELFDCRFLTPHTRATPFLLIRFEALDLYITPHQTRDGVDHTEKYGTGSIFSRIDKFEEPFFLSDFRDALHRVRLKKGALVLDIGINQGDEFAGIAHWDYELFATLRCTGVDHSASAIRHARHRFPSSRFTFIQADLSELDSSDLGRFDLLISVDTLQCSNMDGKDLFIKLVKGHLKDGGAVILGFPNVRYLDGELKYGAKMKNFTKPDLSLLVKDLFFYRRYLQKRGYRVTLTGKYTLFLTAERPECN